jgi:hypothetical protein
MGSVLNRLLLIGLLNRLLLVDSGLLHWLLLVDSRLLLVDWLLRIVPVGLLSLRWLGFLINTSCAHRTWHAVSSCCAMSVKVDACDGKSGDE